MEFAYDGYLKNVITIKSEDLVVGDIVALNKEGTAVKAKRNDKFLGVVTSTGNGYSGVQTTGYIEVSFVGTIEPGFNKLLAGSEKTVILSETGRELLVLKVDTDGCIGVIL